MRVVQVPVHPHGSLASVGLADRLVRRLGGEPLEGVAATFWSVGVYGGTLKGGLPVRHHSKEDLEGGIFAGGPTARKCGCGLRQVVGLLLVSEPRRRPFDMYGYRRSLAAIQWRW